KPPTRPVAERVRDWREVYLPYPEPELQKQGARCMDCGIPFCHQGCPLGNLIPDWNDLVYRNRWEPAIERLHATNNFPEFAGLLRYGIPEFKMEKRFLNRRLALMDEEGVFFRTGANVGVDITAAQLKSDFDAIVLAGGAGLPRDLPVPGRELQGIHFAMEYL